MKAYITLFTLTLTSLCLSQSNDKSNEFKLSNLSVGLTATRVLDKLHYPLSYELNASGGKTMGTITDQSSSSFYQLNAQYQLTQRFYVYSALGAGVDRQDSDFPLYSPTAVVWFFNSGYSTTVRRYITVKEKRTSMVGSLEVGFNLFKPKRRFNLGVGLGIDFYTLVKTVHDNGMIITTDVITTISTPGNASSTTNTTTAEHDYQSEEWNEHVLNAQWSPFVPKLTLTVSYKIAGRVTIFGKGQVRFLLQNGDHVSERSVLQYPISGGIQYNFK